MGVPLLLMAIVVVGAGFMYRQRLRDYVGRGRDRIDDDMIRRIEGVGSVEVEDEIDLDEVRAEEENFWNETWDQPDEEW